MRACMRKQETIHVYAYHRKHNTSVISTIETLRLVSNKLVINKLIKSVRLMKCVTQLCDNYHVLRIHVKIRDTRHQVTPRDTSYLRRVYSTRATLSKQEKKKKIIRAT